METLSREYTATLAVSLNVTASQRQRVFCSRSFSLRSNEPSHQRSDFVLRTMAQPQRDGLISVDADATERLYALCGWLSL